MKITLKTEFAVRLFAFLVILILCTAVYINGRDLSCNKCVVRFITYKRGKDTVSNQIVDERSYSISINHIYENFLNETCVIEFEREGGYIFYNATRFE